MSNSMISASTLFHFTKTKEDLLNILENEFCPQYSAEDIPTLDTEGSKPHYYMPMVCFSDIPLSRIEEHADFYGDYAIGLSKEWGRKNHLNPVLYLNADSFLSKAFRESTEIILKSPPTPANEDLIRKLINVSSYTKRYEGKPWRKGKRLDDKRIFYNEKEWRYTPSPEEAIKIGVPLSLKEFDETKILAYQEILKNNAKLKFEPSDIRYLIVKDESEILSFIKELERIKFKYNLDTVKVLSTRILTMEHVRKDF